VYSIEAYWTGRADAERDTRAGRLVIERFGLLFGEGDYVTILRQRYQIEMKTVAGCLVDDEIVGHAVGYNEIMKAEIERRFGPGLLERVREEAEAEAEANRKPALPEPAWKTLLMLIGLPFLIAAYCVVWLLLEFPEKLRARIERGQKSRWPD